MGEAGGAAGAGGRARARRCVRGTRVPRPCGLARPPSSLQTGVLDKYRAIFASLSTSLFLSWLIYIPHSPSEPKLTQRPTTYEASATWKSLQMKDGSHPFLGVPQRVSAFSERARGPHSWS